MKVFEFIKSGFPPSLFFITIAALELSQNKLKAKNIRAMNINSIIEAGGVKMVCFDKTGTLTENELKIYGHILNENKELESVTNDLN